MQRGNNHSYSFPFIRLFLSLSNFNVSFVLRPRAGSLYRNFVSACFLANLSMTINIIALAIKILLNFILLSKKYQLSKV